MKFRLPRTDEHTAIVGRNGSGKTQMGVYLLSKQDLKKDVWFVLDYKGDELINGIERLRQVDYKDLPKEPGLYVLQPRPDEVDETEEWLWKIWQREKVGLYVDEGYMIPNIGAFNALLTQGRSKRIPMITLSQRPVAVSRFAFSEASHLIVFDLNDRRDEKTIEGYTPRGFIDWLPDGFEGGIDQFDTRRRLLPKFHSRWWNVKDRAAFMMKPVPEADVLIDEINSQLEPKVRWF